MSNRLTGMTILAGFPGVFPPTKDAMTTTQAPTDHAESVAMFRYAVIGPLLHSDFEHGERSATLRDLSRRLYRPPGSHRTRRYGLSTIERWYYTYLREGIAGLYPGARSDKGRARALSPELRELLLDIRREYPTVSSPLVLRTLISEQIIPSGLISVATLNRLYAENGLRRKRRGPKSGEQARRQRRRWQVEQPGVLWHSDVCHGPTLIDADGKKTPVRIHALLDDASRYITALEVHTQEREVEMLGMLARAIQRHGVPKRLYLDNGSTYRGDDLVAIGARLQMKVTHAGPYDPEARGKMERFWRTMREQCLDFIGSDASLHDVRVRLHAWLDQHYHRAPHAGLLGKTPTSAWEVVERATRHLQHDTLLSAFTTRVRRKVRKDSTLSIDGQLYEVAQAFLAGKTVTVICGLEPFDRDYAPQVVVEGRAYPLHQVDPVSNAKRGRKSLPVPKDLKPTHFNPAQTYLDRATGRPTAKKETT